MIFAFFGVWIIASIIEAIFQKPKRRAKPKPITYTVTVRHTRTIKQLQSEVRQRDMLERQRERERQKAERDRLRRQQAQADLIFYEQQLDKVSELLLLADAELEAIEKRIEIDRATLSFDSESKDQKQRERIIKKIMQYESRIHSLEARLAKAKLTAEAV